MAGLHMLENKATLRRAIYDCEGYHVYGQGTVLRPNAELSAAPLAGVESEPGVGWRPPQQTVRRRRGVVERTCPRRRRPQFAV